MSTPIDRLRAADPAAGSGPQPDERAEADLRLLLAEPHGASAAAPHREHRRLVPILVTALVAVVLIAGTLAVLGAVRPRVDVGGSIAPTLGTSSCHPAQVLPFQCGTYESTYGGKAITGDAGGPAKDRLRISFTPEDGALLLTASTITCFAETVLVRVEGKRLVRIGTPEYSENDCHGPGADRGSWAYAFLNGPLVMTGVDGPYFGTGDSSVFFQYLGSAPIGEQQLPRNDSACVPSHVAPFSCGPYFSSAGTGPVSFLGSSLFRLSFQHVNGQLTAELYGRCNAMSVAMEPDGNTIVLVGGGSTAMGCGGSAGSQDGAVRQFFAGTVMFRVDGPQLTFTSGSSTAVFSTDIGACRPSAANSPFCGTSTASGGSGSVAFLSGAYRLTFGESGSRLTATVQGSCGTTVDDVTVGWSTLRFRRSGAVDEHSCPAGANAHDVALAAFLAQSLTFRWDGERLTLDRAASGPFSSATFTRSR